MEQKTKPIHKPITKPINKTNKGNRVKLLGIKEFEKSGYLVSSSEKSGRYQKQKDLFGLFDFVAIREDEVCFVQITCNKPHSHKLYLEFSLKYQLTDAHFIQGVWHDRDGWVWFNYVNGTKYIEDLRSSSLKKLGGKRNENKR